MGKPAVSINYYSSKVQHYTIIVSYPYSYFHIQYLILMYNHYVSDVGCNMHVNE